MHTFLPAFLFVAVTQHNLSRAGVDRGAVPLFCASIQRFDESCRVRRVSLADDGNATTAAEVLFPRVSDHGTYEVCARSASLSVMCDGRPSTRADAAVGSREHNATNTSWWHGVLVTRQYTSRCRTAFISIGVDHARDADIHALASGGLRAVVLAGETGVDWPVSTAGVEDGVWLTAPGRPGAGQVWAPLARDAECSPDPVLVVEWDAGAEAGIPALWTLVLSVYLCGLAQGTWMSQEPVYVLVHAVLINVHLPLQRLITLSALVTATVAAWLLAALFLACVFVCGSAKARSRFLARLPHVLAFVVTQALFLVTVAALKA